jgi:hypothetical protein
MNRTEYPLGKAVPVHAMRAYVRVEVSLQVFLPSTVAALSLGNQTLVPTEEEAG